MSEEKIKKKLKEAKKLNLNFFKVSLKWSFLSFFIVILF